MTIDEEFDKLLKQFHKLSDRHILVAETDMSCSDIQKVVELSDRIRKAGNELVGLMKKNYDQLMRTKRYRGLLGNKSSYSNRLIPVFQSLWKYSYGVRLQAKLGSKNPTGLPVGVGLEQSYLTASDKGDSPSDESFSASSSEGKAMTIELTYSYQFQQDTLNKVFTRFKGRSGVEVRDSFIKPNIVSWTKEVIAKYKVSDIIGSKREEVNVAITDYLADKFADYNISISNVSLSNVEVDEDTKKAIDAKIAAQQNAETQAIQNQTNIDKAKADAEAKVTAAQGDADAKVIAAQAEADANAKINSSITDQLIRMKEAEARLKHGWVTVQGSDTVVTKDADSDK